MELCCKAGDEIASSGTEGSVTLLFRNRASVGQILVLTCSHVVGGFDQSPPPDGGMIGGRAECRFQARTLGNTIAKDGTYEFDIAVGEVFEISDGFEGLRVAGEAYPLDSFADANVFVEHALLSVSSEVSDFQFIAVNSARTQITDITAVGGRTVTAENIYVCTGSIAKGDSGGIVYDGSQAAGIVIGRAVECF